MSSSQNILNFNYWFPARREKEAILSPERIVSPTDSAVEKAGRSDDAVESVFSAHVFPTELYSDIFKAFSIQCILDLSAGQGQAAQAALENRLCYVGFGLSDKHVEALEKRLTQKVLEDMEVESSTFYRPEMAAAKPNKDDGDEEKTAPKKRQGSGRRRAARRGKPLRKSPKRHRRSQPTESQMQKALAGRRLGKRMVKTVVRKTEIAQIPCPGSLKIQKRCRGQ